MDRLASSLFFVLLSSSSLVACGDDTGTGSGTESATGTGTGSGSDSGTTASTQTSMTNAGTMGGTSDTTGMTDPTAADSTSTGDATATEGTTTAGDACEECVAENCAAEVMDCADDRDCQCWIDCINDGNEPPVCGMMCNGMPPEPFFELTDCIDGDCDAECNGGGATSGGMGDGETYQMCADDADCPMTDCSGFLGYCSLDCMGDAGNCPMPATGNIEPICGGMMDNRCLLPCGGGGDMCPDGMSCEMGGGGNEICVFP